MDINELRRAHRARPFQRFWLCLADGREIRVAHPELLMVSWEGRSVGVSIPREGFELIDVPLITGVSFRRRKRGRAQPA